MRVSVLCFDMSANCLGRAYMLAEMLHHRYDVEVIGPSFNGGVWAPLDPPPDSGIPLKAVPGGRYPGFLSTLDRLAEEASGDILYPCKTRPSSLWPALAHRSRVGAPVVLDIDDFESAVEMPGIRERVHTLMDLTNPNGYAYTRLSELLAAFADAKTVASGVLMRRFGGTYIPHARDTDLLDPARYDRAAIRGRMGIGNEFIVLFYGTPRPHKGLEEAARAVASVRRRRRDGSGAGAPLPQLMVVGSGLDAARVLSSPVLAELAADGGLRVEGYQPFGRIPEFLSVADAVVLAQQQTRFARAQLPAKLVDAMAMAVPVIATRVSDLPAILDGCGLMVDFRGGVADPEQVAQAIAFLMDNPDRARDMGRATRARCVERFSYRVVGERLRRLFRRFE